MRKKGKKTAVKTTTPRVPLFIHQAVAKHAKERGSTVQHSYETLITLGLQRQKSFEEMLDGK